MKVYQNITWTMTLFNKGLHITLKNLLWTIRLNQWRGTSLASSVSGVSNLFNDYGVLLGVVNDGL